MGAAAYDQPVPTISEIASALAELTQPAGSPQWDPVGLQLGDPDGSVTSIAVCHEVNDAVVFEVERDPVDLLVTYHPLLFSPTRRILTGSSPGGRSYRLLAAGVGLLVTHTDFDAAPGGSADALAGFFGLREVTPFGGDPVSGEPGLGRHGEFGESLASIDARLTDAFGPIGLRLSGDRDSVIDRLAVLPGSGGSFIEAAAEVADCLVTGDVSHHRAVAARDLGLAIADPGHTATERPGMEALVRLVGELSDIFVRDLTHIDPQTWD